MTRQAIVLFVGTALLLLVSGGIILWGSRGNAAAPATTTPTRAIAVAATATAPAATETPAPQPTATKPITPTTRLATSGTATASPRTAATATRAASATPGRPLVANGPCTMALPTGFAEERPGGGYYPASDQTGFAALDQFSTENGARSAESLAQGFLTTNLGKVLQGVQQTGAEGTADGGYRIDFTATVGGQPGRGSTYVRPFGTVACGATLFLLDRSTLPFATTREVMILSVGTR